MRDLTVYRTVGQLAWRIWLATALLVVGTSLAADPAIGWRVIGCCALLWVPLLIVDHLAAMMQDVIDHTARDLDARDALILAALDETRAAAVQWPAAPATVDSRPDPPVEAVETVDEVPERAAEHFAATVGHGNGSHEYGTAIIEPVTESTAVMPPLDDEARDPDVRR